MTVHEHIAEQSRRHPALRIAVIQGALPDDWRTIHDRLQKSSHNLANALLLLVAALATFTGVVVSGGIMALGLWHFVPDLSPYYVACLVILPALLAGASLGQSGGNLFLRAFYRLDDASRRGFATRLSLARCPEDWPNHLRRWLFTGDWLGTPSYDLRLPYVRIYIEGDAPHTCREEDRIWREIHTSISGDTLWEAGTNIREISYPSKLPSWARKVEKGDGFDDLRDRIGQTEASQWVMHLWRRACRQWPTLAANDYPEQARRECFEMHSLTLKDGRDALIVVLRPVSFVLEMDPAVLRRERLAA